MSNKLTKFEAGRIDSLISEINSALKPIADKYGLKDLKLGRVSYNAAEFKTSMHVKIGAEAEDSTAVLKRQQVLSRAIGFAENVFGREMYASDGHKYRVVDINTKKRKYPIVGERISDPSKSLLFTSTIRFIGPVPKTVQQELMEQLNNRPNARIVTLNTLGNPNSNNNKP